MKKITKTLVAILLIAIMSMANVTVFAANEEISPRLSHTNSASFYFSAADNQGYVDVTYQGFSSFVRADLNVKIQKRFLLVFWNDVDEWNVSSTNVQDVFHNEFNLNGSGTYRAVFTLKVTGNNGTVDTVEKTIESKY